MRIELRVPMKGSTADGILVATPRGTVNLDDLTAALGEVETVDLRPIAGAVPGQTSETFLGREGRLRITAIYDRDAPHRVQRLSARLPAPGSADRGAEAPSGFGPRP